MNSVTPFVNLFLERTTLQGLFGGLYAHGHGDIIVKLGDQKVYTLKNVYYVPSSPWCIFSAHAGQTDGISTILDVTKGIVSTNDHVIGEQSDRRYIIEARYEISESCNMSATLKYLCEYGMDPNMA